MTSQHPLLLLVDDNDRILDVVARFARRAGFDVVTCAGGRQALEQLRRQPADLAMVDLRMPDVNGLDVLRAIRETVPGCEVILMTGYAGIDSAWEGNVRELRNVVERACILAEGDLITEQDLAVTLPATIDPPLQLAPPSFSNAMVQVTAEQVPADDDTESLASIERDHITRTPRRACGNKKVAAKMLGLS